MSDPFLIYGVNGYTGQLIVEEATKQGLKPVLAGRSEASTAALAQQYGLDYRIGSLDQPKELDAVLQGMQVVMHCAGPYEFTAKSMVEACVRKGVHYYDVDGNYKVFEQCATYDAAAKATGAMILVGCGFNVAPSDCLVLYLKQQLPSATHLELTMLTESSKMSQGTAKSVVEKLGQKAMVRQNGKLVPVPLAWQTRLINFGTFTSKAFTAPIGDLVTAFHSTQIPNIHTFIAADGKTIFGAKLSNYLGWLLQSNWVKNRLKRRIEKGPAGPSDQQRNNTSCIFHAMVWDEQGNEKQATMSTPNGYTFTALAVVKAAQRILSGKAKPGFQTPASALGTEWVLELSGVVRKG